MYNTVLCCKYLSSGIMLGFFMLPVACWQSEWVSHVAVVAHREGSSGREPGMPGEGRHGGWTCERAEFRGERARAGETPVSLSLPAFGNRAAAFYSKYRTLLDPCFTSSLRGWEDIHTTSRMDW